MVRAGSARSTYVTAAKRSGKTSAPRYEARQPSRLASRSTLPYTGRSLGPRSSWLPCARGRGAERPRCGMKRGGSAGRTGSRRSACDALRPCETIAVTVSRLRGCPSRRAAGVVSPYNTSSVACGATFSSEEKAVGSFSNCRGRRPRRPDNPSVFCCAKSTLPYTGRAFGPAHFMAPP